jgi:hypothetical protein
LGILNKKRCKNKDLIKINEIEQSNKNNYFIIKPNYGTQGQSIMKITLNEIFKLKKNYYYKNL